MMGVYATATAGEDATTTCEADAPATQLQRGER
jgi:hypothetical protein